MKTLTYLLMTGVLLCTPFSAYTQIANLKVNNSSSSFTMMSGDTIKWEFNCPVGAAINGELWYDVNGNGAIDPGADVARFIFTQTDGDASGNGGPPDLDGSVNGHQTFYQRVGVAPGKYILKFTHNSVGAALTGTAMPLASPAHMISGHVTAPANKSSQYINVVVHRSDQFGNPDFWDSYTDAAGNYQIAMNADTAGNPWGVRIENNPYPPAIISPADTMITIIGNPSGINFTFLQAPAQVAGYLKDDSGVPIPGASVYASVVLANGNNLDHNVQTANSGFFQIGFLSTEVQQTQDRSWRLASSYENDGTTNRLVAQKLLPILHNGDSLFYNLISYRVNSSVQGQVRIDGHAPNFQIEVDASNPDTAFSFTRSDSATGNFTIPVSNKVYNYDVSPANLPNDYYWTPVPAHPGDVGIVINLTTTSVEERTTGIPGQFSLRQNYPNPFNPTTTIEFSLPRDGKATLKVYDVLGREVAELVNKNLKTGVLQQARFDATRFASGLYLARLEFGGKQLIKKMLLMK